CSLSPSRHHLPLHSFPTRRSSDLDARAEACTGQKCPQWERCFITEMRRRAVESDVVIVNHHLFFADLAIKQLADAAPDAGILPRSEEHTSELQSLRHLVCRLLLEK